MSYAPTSVYRDCGDGSIIGGFDFFGTSRRFEYSANPNYDPQSANFTEQYPHLIWVAAGSQIIEGIESGYRYGIVKKTVAYLAVNEDEYGKPVLEKWLVKHHNVYYPE